MAQLVIAKGEESLTTSDFQLLTWLLHLTFLMLQISVRPLTSDFRLLTSDFRLPTSNFGLQSFHHFPFHSSKCARFLLLEFSARAQALIFLEIEPIMTANLTHPAIEIYWTSGESSAYQIIPCAASQKQLPLLKESSAYLTINLSENL